MTKGHRAAAQSGSALVVSLIMLTLLTLFVLSAIPKAATRCPQCTSQVGTTYGGDGRSTFALPATPSRRTRHVRRPSRLSSNS